MTVSSTPLTDLYVLEPEVFEDPRGYFFESFNQEKFNSQNLHFNFVQDNQSKSSYGVVRGLHYQLKPKAQSKLVRVLEGIIYDVAVDIRPDSPGYGKWYGIELSEENRKQLLVPKGFAHGFSVLSETAVVLYKCDELYSPQHDAGIRYNDQMLNIDWQIPADKIILSAKDSALPNFNEARKS